MIVAIALILLAVLTGTGPGAPPPQALLTPSDAVVLRLDTPSGRTFTVTVPDGGRATVGRQNGRTLGLVATLTAAGRLDVVITRRDIDPTTGGETWPEVGRMSLAPREQMRFEDAVFPFGLEWVDSRPRTPTAERTAGDPCQRCCVVCGGEVVCGCRVQSACGDCCCAATCGCEIAG